MLEYTFLYIACVYTHELIHHVTQGEDKKWELCTALFLTNYVAVHQQSTPSISLSWAKEYVTLAIV